MTGSEALAGQQLAGAVMCVPFGVMFVVVALTLVAGWMGEVERRVFTTEERVLRGDA